MNSAKSVLLKTLPAIVCLLGAYATPAAAQALSKAEQIYADLAKLSPEERTAKVLEGAKREGKISIIQTMREELGNGVWFGGAAAGTASPVPYVGSFND